MTQHILLYTDEPGVGGIAQYNHALLMALAKRGDRATVVQSYRENPLLTAQQKAGIHHHWLPFDTMADFQRTFMETADARTALQQHQPDLLLFIDGCPLSNFAAKQVAVELKIPFLVIVRFVAPTLAHHFSGEVDPTPILAKLATYYQQAKTVVAVSQNNLDLLRSVFHLPPDRGQVIYSGRPAQYFKQPCQATRQRRRIELSIPKDAVVCFTPARLEPIKGYQYQLDAILQLQQEHRLDPLHFVWAGEGYLREWLEQRIEQETLSDRIHLIGHRWDIADWLDMADIFVLPSEVEGMPLAVMEAMAKGLPVVASAVSGIPEELGQTGILLPDPTAHPEKVVQMLARTLDVLANNGQKRLAMGQAARQRAEQLFREDRMVRESLLVIDQALSGAPDGDSLTKEPANSPFPNKLMTKSKLLSWNFWRRQAPGIGHWVSWLVCQLAIAGDIKIIDSVLDCSQFCEVSEALVTNTKVGQRKATPAKFFPTTKNSADLPLHRVQPLLPLNLRSLNWVAFPDWHQPEADLLTDLMAVLRFAITHPEHQHLTLLLIINTESKQAELALATAAMQLFVAENLELKEDGPDIVFIPDLSLEQWRGLTNQLSGRLHLRIENQSAIASLQQAIAEGFDQFRMISL